MNPEERDAQGQEVTRTPEGPQPEVARHSKRPRRRRPERIPFALDEGLPTLALAFSAVVSFAVLMLAPYFALPLLLRLTGSGEDPGPLAIPVFTGSLFEALAGTTLLLVLGLILVAVERFRPFPTWLPVVLSVPLAWLLLLPSAVQFGGSWLAWLVFGAILAGIFSFHWYLFRSAAGAWD